MKVIIVCFLLVWCQIPLTGCLKTNIAPGVASLTLVNAIPNSNPLVTDFNEVNNKQPGDSLLYFASASEVGFGSFAEYSSYSGQQSLSLSPITDTALTIWTGTLSLPTGSSHSLLLAGTDTLHVDTLFTTDIVPNYPYTGDSVMGVRFINLSTGSLPVAITLQSDSTHTPIANNIGYRTVTDFQSMPADANALANGYTFEFRDAGTGTILTSASFNAGTFPALLPFKNVTICLIGLPGAAATVPQSGLIYTNY